MLVSSANILGEVSLRQFGRSLIYKLGIKVVQGWYPAGCHMKTVHIRQLTNQVTSLTSVQKIGLKPLNTDCVNTVYTGLPSKNITISGVEGLFEIHENYTVDKAIININRPAVRDITVR